MLINEILRFKDHIVVIVVIELEILGTFVFFCGAKAIYFLLGSDGAVIEVSFAITENFTQNIASACLSKI